MNATCQKNAAEADQTGARDTTGQSWVTPLRRWCFSLLALALLTIGSLSAKACSYVSSDPNVDINGVVFNQQCVGVDFTFTGIHRPDIEVWIDVGGEPVVTRTFRAVAPGTRISQVWANPFPYRRNACIRVFRWNAPVGVMEQRHLTR